MKFLCIGHATYDITLPMNSYPIENTKVKVDYEKVECGGGSAANSAYLLKKWGMDTYFSGVIGADYEGTKILKEFKSIGVNTDYIEIRDDVVTTTSYIIANTNNGTRTILTSKDKDLTFEQITSVNLKPDVILVDGNHKELAKKVLLDNKDAITIIDAGRYNDDVIELGKLVKYFVCSNDFAKEYTKIDFDYNDLDALKKVYDILAKDFTGQVVITLEKEGCFTRINDEYIKVPSIKVKAIDSTGAGDIFHGAFTYFIANNFNLLLSLKLSNIAGALSVTKIGSRYSIPELKDVILEYKKHE